MTHLEFHQAVGAIANGRYFTTLITATTPATGRTRVRWQAYIDGQDWTRLHDDPRDAIAEIAGTLHTTKLEDLGAPPKSSPAPFEPVAPTASYAEEGAAPVI